MESSLAGRWMPMSDVVDSQGVWWRGVEAAIVEASGFIWEIKGQSAAAPPTAAAAPVATNKKSRRVGWSAEDAVVTIPNPFLAAAGGTARETPKVGAQ